MLKIMTGPEASGLSRILCREMIRTSLQSPDDPCLVIVPEQATLKMQRMAVEEHPSHALMHVDIVSFERLAHKVFEELGYRESDILNDTGKVLILRNVLEKNRDELRLYRNKIHMHGFAREMKSAITELKQYTIDDNDLFLMQEAAQQKENRILYDKLQDIRLIYRKFNEEIAERYTTQEEVLGVFARLAGKSELIKNARIYLDGFTGFTPVQYRLIEELMTCASEMTVTVTLPEQYLERPAEEHDLFALSSKTRQKLLRIAEKTGTPAETIPVKEAGHLPSAFLYSGADIRREAAFAAGEILKEVRAGRMRFRDFAVIVSDMELYYPVLRETFEEAEIPCFIDHKSPLSDNILARFLIAALQVVSERFSYDSMFSLLKSGISSLSFDETGLLENYCLEFGVRGPSAWMHDFTRNRLLKKDPENEENSRYFWDLAEINRLRRKAVRHLPDFYEACSGTDRTAGDYCHALKEFLERSKAEERMKLTSEELSRQEDVSRAKEYEQIFGLVTGLLDQIERLMGGEKIRPAGFSEILTGALDEIRVGIIPPSLDAVTAGDLTRTRIGDVKALFLMGVNDGKLPAAGSSAGLFTRQERELLRDAQFELAPTVLEDMYIQHFYIYLMLTRPSEKLYLTWASHSEEGEELLPSYIIEGIGDILPGLCPEPAAETEPVLWKSRAVRLLAEDAAGFAAAETAFPENHISLLRYFALRDNRVLEQILSGACFRNSALPLDEQTALDLYGDVLRGSVSRFETFYACPFRYFLNYGLHMEERPEFQMEAADYGTLYHESLERYSKKLEEQGLSFRDVSDEDSERVASEAVAEAAENMGDVLTDTERSRYLLKRIEEVTRRTADVLRLHVRQGLYEPSYFEMAFQDAELEGTAFRGKIDRVDLYDGGDLFVKVIDYKSGSKKFSIRDIYTGQQLQLVAYMKEAINEIKKTHPGRTVRAGGVYYYLIQDRFVSTRKDADEKFRMSGVTNCDPEALRAIDTEAEAKGASMIAEIRYASKGLDQRSKVANDGEFEHLMTFVSGRIDEAGQRIRSGEVSISPSYESPAKHACTYCEYREICKFEPGKWGSDYRKVPDEITPDEMERELYGRY